MDHSDTIEHEVPIGIRGADERPHKVKEFLPLEEGNKMVGGMEKDGDE